MSESKHLLEELRTKFKNLSKDLDELIETKLREEREEKLLLEDLYRSSKKVAHSLQEYQKIIMKSPTPKTLDLKSDLDMVK